MAINKGYERYRQNAILNAPPEELTLMLYNGCIKFLKLGMEHIENKNPKGAHENIIKAQNIIMELNNTLDMKFKISEDLRKLYTFMYEQLVEANLKKDVNKILEVLPMVEDLRNTWKEAMTLSKDPKTAGKVPISINKESKEDSKKEDINKENNLEPTNKEEIKKEIKEEIKAEKEIDNKEINTAKENTKINKEEVKPALDINQKPRIPKPNMNRLNAYKMNAYKKKP